MIKIDIRGLSVYNEMSVRDESISFDTGLLDEKESMEQAVEFLSAAEDLLPPGDRRCGHIEKIRRSIERDALRPKQDNK